MIATIRKAAPQASARFTPLFGFSQNVIPQWLAEQHTGFQVDFAFLDGGNRPAEQVTEMRLRLNPVEVAAVVVPPKLRGTVLRWLPKPLARRLADGRK